jgi:hypothetical protein
VSKQKKKKKKKKKQVTSGSSINLKALQRRSTVSSDIGIGEGPTPFAWILSPQKN